MIIMVIMGDDYGYKILSIPVTLVFELVAPSGKP